MKRTPAYRGDAAHKPTYLFNGDSTANGKISVGQNKDIEEVKKELDSMNEVKPGLIPIDNPGKEGSKILDAPSSVNNSALLNEKKPNQSLNSSINTVFFF